MIDTQDLIEICNSAGSKIMDIYNSADSASMQVEYKSDNSPLTLADKESNKIICHSLKSKYPEIPILSEEGAQIDYKERKRWTKFWLIDPIDGTKEFIKKNGEFTINIALIDRNEPILGVIFAPAKSTLYMAKKNCGAFKINTKVKLDSLDDFTKISVSNQLDCVRIVGSRSHSNANFTNWVKKKFPNAKIVEAGSSLKFCLIAEGKADIYPRFGPTSEWDIAAGHIIINEAGGKISTFNETGISYNTKENILNPEFYAIGNIKLN